MGYTVDEIRGFQNPYQILGTGDALAENHTELNKLNDEEKLNLATSMILECPQNNLRNFGKAIESTRIPQDDEQSFHAVLFKAFEVKSRILSLIDPRYETPHKMMLAPEFDDELFITFKELATKVLDDKEAAAAIRLAQTTPDNDCSQVSRNISNIFPRSVFAADVQAAFALRRDIKRYLLGDQPEKFFASRDFSIDLCLKFSGLFPTLLKGHEQAIGEKLALLDEKTRADINLKLERINPCAHDQSSSLRMIAAAMAPKVEAKQQQKQAIIPEVVTLEAVTPEVVTPKAVTPETVAPKEEVTPLVTPVSNASNRSALFNTNLRLRVATKEEFAAELRAAKDEEVKADKGSCSSCWGLLK